MNKIIFNTPSSIATLLLCVAAIVTSCKKYLPEERETVGADSQFTTDTYQPVLGRTTFFTSNFFKGSTTFPSTFKIVNPRRRNGDPAPELTDVFPVQVWKEAYTGQEKSLDDIEAKRVVQNRPIFEISPHSGAFTMWAEGRSSFLRPQPDSGYLFDVELSNSGGRRYYRSLKLMPFRERPFEPSNFNAISGQSLSNGVYPSVVSFIMGDSSERYLSPLDIDVYIRKIVKPNASPSHTLTFKFLDKYFRPMDPSNFDETDWAGLIHGFEMNKTNTSVTYKVAYPIPLVELPTRYTSSDGKRARVRFSYSRLGFGGVLERSILGLDFSIYEPGEWEIVFAFKKDNPRFE